jgi:hypothetical protein
MRMGSFTNIQCSYHTMHVSVSNLVLFYSFYFSLAKVEKEVRVEREEKPQPVKRHHNHVVPRPVFNFLLVVSIVS